MAKNLYFATDKNIYDALHHKRITPLKLQEWLLESGIIVSSELDKEQLVEEVCKLPHGYKELERIKEHVRTYDPRESTTNLALETSTNQAEIKQAIDQVKKTLSASKGETMAVSTKKDGSVSVEFNYQDIDLSKTALRQIDNRSVTIDMRLSDDKVDIRMPQNSEAKKIIRLIQDELSKIKSVTVSTFEISLLSVTDPSLRSKFFQELMDGLDGYELDDVTNVELNRSNGSEYDDDDQEDKIDTGFVKKAVLKGEGVNSSAIFSQLHEKGYYIGRVAWSAKPKTGIGDRINIEAFFKNAEQCCDFSYQIRGINNQRSDGYNVSIRAATTLEKEKISKLVEQAAEHSYTKIVGKKEG